MCPSARSEPEGVLAETVAVVGLGYVGLPVAVALAPHVARCIGFDISTSRIDELRAGRDRTGEAPVGALEETRVVFSADPASLEGVSFFVVAVPTPIDPGRRPDLTLLRRAARTVGERLGRGAVVVFESTVYPGVTEEICGPILAEASGLEAGVDFHLAYSPERINPGDRAHSLADTVKVVAADAPEALDRVAAVYGRVVRAGVHRAPSIRVAEAAKVIENTQRDLNIALMNELAMILDRLGLRTREVLDAAETKWNFLPFRPGLVGGHCIGVDPYYLTSKAEAVGYHPEVILAGRRINDGMGVFVAQRLVKELASRGVGPNEARVGVLGLTFKEDVPDLRNSQVVDLVRELQEFGCEVWVHDPVASAQDASELHGIALRPLDAFRDLAGVVVAVGHRAYRQMAPESLLALVRPGGVVCDVKSILDPADVPEPYGYWSL